MKETIDKFLKQVKEYEELKDKLEEVRAELTASMAEIGMNAYFQDQETDLVYKIVKPKGTFISYKDIDYVRTAKEGERQGSLSKKEAQEKGFILK